MQANGRRRRGRAPASAVLPASSTTPSVASTSSAALTDSLSRTDSRTSSLNGTAASTSTLSSALYDGESLDCAICADEMDLSDVNFRPCPCGFQICRFCHHRLKESSRPVCPACRTPYDDANIQFTPVPPAELKRMQALQKQRERERKDLEAISQSHLGTARIRHKLQVHIQGLTASVANEERLPRLKADLLTQYGTVVKVALVRRPPATASAHPLSAPVSLYVNYTRPLEATACIAALDGSSYEGVVLYANNGTTKYCSTWLRGHRCTLADCPHAHELGEEVDDSFDAPNRADSISVCVGDALSVSLTSPRKATAKDSDVRPSSSRTATGLPASASWGSKMATGSGPTTPTQSTSPLPNVLAAPPPARPIQRTASSSTKPLATVLPARPPSRTASPVIASPPPLPLPSSSKPAPPPGFEAVHAALSSSPSDVQPLRDAVFAVPTPLSPAADEFDRVLDAFGTGSFNFSLGALSESEKGAPAMSALPPLPSTLDVHLSNGIGRSILGALDGGDDGPSAYAGAFNPFSDLSDPSGADLGGRSRFGFARSASTEHGGGGFADLPLPPRTAGGAPGLGSPPPHQSWSHAPPPPPLPSHMPYSRIPPGYGGGGAASQPLPAATAPSAPPGLGAYAALPPPNRAAYSPLPLPGGGGSGRSPSDVRHLLNLASAAGGSAGGPTGPMRWD